MNSLTLAGLNKPHQFIQVGWQRSNERMNGPDSMYVVYPIMAENLNFPDYARGKHDLKYTLMGGVKYHCLFGGQGVHHD